MTWENLSEDIAEEFSSFEWISPQDIYAECGDRERRRLIEKCRKRYAALVATPEGRKKFNEARARHRRENKHRIIIKGQSFREYHAQKQREYYARQKLARESKRREGGVQGHEQGAADQADRIAV